MPHPVSLLLLHSKSVKGYCNIWVIIISDCCTDLVVEPKLSVYFYCCQDITCLIPYYVNTNDCSFLPFQSFLVDPMNSYTKITFMVCRPDICSSGNVSTSFRIALIFFFINLFACSLCVRLLSSYHVTRLSVHLIQDLAKKFELL